MKLTDRHDDNNTPSAYQQDLLFNPTCLIFWSVVFHFISWKMAVAHERKWHTYIIIEQNLILLILHKLIKMLPWHHFPLSQITICWFYFLPSNTTFYHHQLLFIMQLSLPCLITRWHYFNLMLPP